MKYEETRLPGLTHLFNSFRRSNSFQDETDRCMYCTTEIIKDNEEIFLHFTKLDCNFYFRVRLLCNLDFLADMIVIEKDKFGPN